MANAKDTASTPGVKRTMVGGFAPRMMDVVELDYVSAPKRVVNADGGTGSVTHQILADGIYHSN